MQTLLKLSRFIDSDEQKQLVQELVRKGFRVRSDSLVPVRRLLVEGEFNERVDGVNAAIPIIAEEKTRTLSDVVSVLKRVGPAEGFVVKANFIGDVPFHLRAIRERLRKKKVVENEDNVLYLEAKKTGDSVLVRVGTFSAPQSVARPSVVLVLESPKTAFEVADFLRLGICFGLEVRVSTGGDIRSLHAVQEAKGIVKGHEKMSVQVFRTTEQAVGDMDAIAFSLWGKEDESCLKKLSGPVALVFGNEERGLRLSTQKACKAVVRLGPKSSEPMRASQAASYALGVMA
ncbi:MAG: hypothetical protein JW834_04540 [Candidatus Diapherotrites archaeon]|nr:hypothetical protein [Candidatus Diapherotrites archaeon]